MSFNPFEVDKHPIMRAAWDMATALRDGRTAAADAARGQLRAELAELLERAEIKPEQEK